jgi:hypothetical protein
MPEIPYNGNAGFQEQSPTSLSVCKQIWEAGRKIKSISPEIADSRMRDWNVGGLFQCI